MSAIVPRCEKRPPALKKIFVWTDAAGRYEIEEAPKLNAVCCINKPVTPDEYQAMLGHLPGVRLESVEGGAALKLIDADAVEPLAALPNGADFR